MSSIPSPKSSLSFSSNFFFDQHLGSMQLHVPDLAPLLHVTASSADEFDVLKHENSDEEVAEIINFLVEREDGATATPKYWRNQLSTPALLGGDIRAYMTPKSNSRVVSDDNTTSADDPISSSRASFPASHTAPSSLPSLIDLTVDSRVHVNVNQPVDRPRKLTAGCSENDTHSKRPVGRPRKLPQETWLKNQASEPPSCSSSDSAPPKRRNRPRKYPIPAQGAPQISVDIPVKWSDGRPSKHIITATQSATAADNTVSSSPISDNSSAISPSSESQTRNVPMRPDDNSLVSALSSAFSQNAAQNFNHELQQEQNLVGALASAFANNVNPNDTDDESSDSSSDPNSDALPKRRRHRISLKRVPQIPSSPVKRLRPKRTPKATYVAPSEETVDAYLNVEYLPVDLPLGISIAPENESKYVDPNDEVLLDYDSSPDILEERKRQEELKSTSSALTLRNNMRFLLKGAPSRSAPRPAPRQYTALVTPSTTTYVQLVEEHCGNHALRSILDELPSWEANLKPRNYFRSRAPIDSVSYESSTSELFSAGEETGKAAKVTKRLHSEEDPVPCKKVKFSDTINVSSFQSSTTGAGDPPSSHPDFDVDLCGELLQKLVKGKIQMSNQEHELVLSFFGNPAFQRIIRDSQVGDGDELDLLSTDNLQACDSIWQAFQHISQSPPGMLGIPAFIEGTLKRETQKMIRSVTAR